MRKSRPAVFSAAAAAGCLLLAASGWAQSPRLDRLEQAGGRPGASMTVRCFGERLDNVRDVLFYREGLEVRAISADDESTVDIELLISPACQLGEHPLRLVGPNGISALRTIQIGPYAAVSEAEPNNGTDVAQPITLGTTVAGLVDEGDIDCFRVSLKQGERLSAEVVGLRLGGFLFDAWLGVVDPNGELIASSDDTALLRQDPLISIVAPRCGDYTVQVREAAYGGDLDSRYLLHVGGYPRPTIAYPAGGPAGETLETVLLGDGGGPIPASIAMDADKNSIIEYIPGGPTDPAPSPIRLRVSDAANVLEAEPNDLPATATATDIRLPVAFNGVLEESGDRDHFRFAARAGDRFDVEVFAARIGSPVDSVVAIHGPGGEEIISNDDGQGQDSAFRFTAPVDGEYTLSITDHLRRGGREHVYRIEFIEIVPSLELTAPIMSFRRPQQRQAVQLPRRGRFAMMVSARRFNFSGPISLAVDSLPVGVTAEFIPIEPHTHLGCIVFEADEDAPTGATLIDIRGSAETERGTVHDSLKQHLGLVFGPPRRTAYHSVELEGMPVVVTETANFQLDVQQPTSPLVQDGRLDLLVKAERRAGFEGEISLSLPLLPPWLEAPEGGVRVPSGASEVVFPLFAKENAERRSWDVVMMGQAAVDGVDDFAFSAPFQVAVEAPFVSLALQPATGELGETARVEGKIQWQREIQGAATARLLGLPKQSDAPQITIAAGDGQLAFPVRVGRDAIAAIHNTLYVEFSVERDGEPITHFLGRDGVLELIEPGAAASAKLSRLEILRRQANRESSPTRSETVQSTD